MMKRFRDVAEVEEKGKLSRTAKEDNGKIGKADI
jgi:hypothetical protein